MKILFLGLGGVGQRHLRNIESILKTKNEIYTVSEKSFKPLIKNDLTLDKTTNIFDKHQIKVVKNISEAFNFNPELTVVSSPSSFHFEHAKLALESKSHVFLEKPATMSSEQCRILDNLSKKNALKVSVSFQLRFTPWIKKIKEIINSNIYGKPVFVSAKVSEYMPGWHKYEDYRDSYAAKKELGGGVVFTQIHEIDYLYYIFGNLKYHASLSGKYSDLDINVEDTAFSLLIGKHLSEDFPISISQDYLGNPKKRELIIQFNEAQLFCDLVSGILIIYQKDKDSIKYSYKDFVRNDAFISQMELFLNSLNDKNANSPVKLDEATHCIDIAEKIIAMR